MSSRTVAPSRSTTWRACPDDGNRYELIDGMLLREPGARRAAPGDGRDLLYVQSRAACPNDLRVMTRRRYRAVQVDPRPRRVMRARDHVCRDSTAWRLRAGRPRRGGDEWFVPPGAPFAVTSSRPACSTGCDRAEPACARRVLPGSMAAMESGRVVSVNLAVVRTDPLTRVKSGRSGIDKRPVDGPVRLGGRRRRRRHDLRREAPRRPGAGRLRLRRSTTSTCGPRSCERLVEPGNVGREPHAVGRRLLAAR